MKKTTNYQLNQWAKTDRILMDDFNADNAKIDAALAALGKAELIQTVSATKENGNDNVGWLPTTGIDWNQWNAVILVGSEFVGTDYTFTFTAMNERGTVAGHCSDATNYTAMTKMMPFAIVFLPLFNASRQVKVLYLGGYAGMGVAACTYDELKNLRVVSGQTGSNYFQHPREYQFWGIR